jgi:hypothetical protein
MYKKVLALILVLVPTSIVFGDDSHSFVLFGTAKNLYGLHLSMNMSVHRFQAVAKFDLSNDAQQVIASDREKHPGRNYLLNPIKTGSNEEFFFSLSRDFKDSYQFNASITACETGKIWEECFQMQQILIERVTVTVASVIINQALTSNKISPFAPAQYQIIEDGEAIYAFPLMNDIVGQFDQILLVRREGDQGHAYKNQKAYKKITSREPKAASVLGAGALMKSKGKDGNFIVLSSLLHIVPP